MSKLGMAAVGGGTEGGAAICGDGRLTTPSFAQHCDGNNCAGCHQPEKRAWHHPRLPLQNYTFRGPQSAPYRKA
jgi:hypothetical protein